MITISEHTGIVIAVNNSEVDRADYQILPLAPDLAFTNKPRSRLHFSEHKAH
jgi:hypothetical protein